MTADPFDRAWHAPLDPPGWDTGVDAHRCTFDPRDRLIDRLLADIARRDGLTRAQALARYRPPQEQP